jgi:hypothetical protein
VAFPQTPLPIKVELSYDTGTTWSDITTNVRSEDQIQITRGRSDWGQQVDPGRCTFSLDNTDGKYSPRNPTSPLYGQIGRNTPCRVSVMTGEVGLWLPGNNDQGNDTLTTPDNAALDVTGDIDVRIEAALFDWYLSDTVQGQGSTAVLTELMGKWNTTGDQRSWTLYTQYGYPKFAWSADGTVNGVLATCTEKLPIPSSSRIALRVVLDVNNGAGGWTARFYTASSITGTWIQLGADVTGVGTTSIFNSTALLQIGNGIQGLAYQPPGGWVYKAEVRNGIGGTVVANPDFTAQTSGVTSFTDGSGRTWTCGGKTEITNRKVRFVGEVSSWTPEWDTGGFDVVCKVEATGVMRRMGQGAVPARSPMYREFTAPYRSNIVAYWPMEDESGATSLASAFEGHPAMSMTGTVTPANYSDWTASDPIPTVGTGSMHAIVPTYTATSYLFARGFFAVPVAGVVSTQRLFSFSQTGTARTWSVYVNTSGNLDLRAYDGDGLQVLSTGFVAFGINGKKRSIGIELTQSGSDIAYRLFAYDIDTSTIFNSIAVSTSGTLTGYTVGRCTTVRFGEDGLMNDTAIGHFAIADGSTAFSSTGGALLGWNGETGAARIFRLGLEEDIPSYSTAPGDEDMGVQARATVLELMRAAAEVDEGILAEQRDILGIRHVQRTSLYNQAPAFVLDYTGDDGLVVPLEPTDDDQQVSNDVTVQRDGGSSARVFDDDTDSPLSILAPPDGVGVYDASYTLSLHDDDQNALHAGWRLHLGTWDETRFPQVSVNLAGAPSSIAEAVACDIGSRIQIDDTPVWLPPDDIDLMVQGYAETLSQYVWGIVFNCTPYGPYTIAQVGSATTAVQTNEFAWAGTEGSQLSEDLTSTETDVDVYTTAGPFWTNNVSDTPFDLRVGGEVMTVTAPGTLQVSNPFFDTSITGWSGSSTTVVWSTDYVNPYPRALASMKVTPAGGVAAVTARSDLTAVGSFVPGQRYRISGWFYSPAGWSALFPSVQWCDSAGTVLSASGATQSVGAGVWTYLEDTVTAPASTSRVRMTARAESTPASTDIFYVWGLRITRLTSSWLYDEFGRTASSTWGNAATGQLWSNSGGTSADFNVTSGYGAHRLATTNASRRNFTDFTQTDADVYVSLTTSATATGGSLMGGPTLRYLDSDNLYQAQVEFTTANVINLTIRKRVAATETQLATVTANFTHTAGTFVRVRFQVIGSTLRAKVWKVADSEPYEWMLTVTDTSLTTSSYAGIRSISATANTNVNPEVRYDNYDMANPQTFLVTRSVNGVVKSQTNGTDVRLASPAYVAL